MDLQLEPGRPDRSRKDGPHCRRPRLRRPLPGPRRPGSQKPRYQTLEWRPVYPSIAGVGKMAPWFLRRQPYRPGARPAVAVAQRPRPRRARRRNPYRAHLDFRHNYMADVGPYYALPENKPSRPFAQASMAGTLMATWPKAPIGPTANCPVTRGRLGHHFHQGFYNETMSGFEHAFASHLIYEGLVAEGLDRGPRCPRPPPTAEPEKANPFNEPEAGNHYARAMASYATFLAAGGFPTTAPPAPSASPRAGRPTTSKRLSPPPKVGVRSARNKKA